MNTALLRQEVQAYLDAQVHTTLSQFIFKGSPFPDITIQELAQQLDGKRRSEKKLPLWYTTKGILFPPKLNLEQTSSAFTARYKASLVSGTHLLDMTGGFGIDSYYFSKRVTQVHHVEMNVELSAFAKANFKTLQANNISCYSEDSVAFLQSTPAQFDTIYLDPARRDDVKGKVFKLSDCVPDVPAHLDLLLGKCHQVLVKTSPLLDLTVGLRELQHVSAIHILAVHNEVKEVLWQLEKTQEKDVIQVVAVNKHGDTVDTTSALLPEILSASATFSEPKRYLYEPNAAIMKSGAFDWVSTYFKVDKLHTHSHLYTHHDLMDFPGRRFEIREVLPFTNKLKRHLTLKKANITTRNFKLSVAAIRKKLQIQEGGDSYLFFTTDLYDKQIVLVCERVMGS